MVNVTFDVLLLQLYCVYVVVVKLQRIQSTIQRNIIIYSDTKLLMTSKIATGAPIILHLYIHGYSQLYYLTASTCMWLYFLELHTVL